MSDKATDLKLDWVDHGVGEIVVYEPETGKAVCVFDDPDGDWDWPENYVVSGEAKANARHIVKCVNLHDALVAAFRDAFNIILADANTEENYASLCRMGSVIAKIDAYDGEAGDG